MVRSPHHTHINEEKMVEQLIGKKLRENTDRLIEKIVKRLFDDDPNQGLFSSMGIDRNYLRKLAREDIGKLFLAVISNRPNLFKRYIAWQRSMIESRLVPVVVLRHNYQLFAETISDEFDDEQLRFLTPILQAGYEVYDNKLTFPETYIDSATTAGLLARQYIDLLLGVKKNEAFQAILSAVGTTVSFDDVYLNLIQSVQYEIGRLWQINAITPAQEHYATAASMELMAKLHPMFPYCTTSDKKLLTACLATERHEVGLKIVSDYLGLHGWQTYFTGANTPHFSILNLIETFQPHVIAFSITMSMHIPGLIELIQTIRKTKKDKIKILIGGYLPNEEPDIVHAVNADAYAKDPQDALEVINNIYIESH